MVKYTDKFIKKIILFSVSVIFILSFVFLNLIIIKIKQYERKERIRYSTKTISQLFNQEDIELLINGKFSSEKEVLLEKLNLIFKLMIHKLNLERKDIFIANKEKKGYSIVFFADQAPNKKGIIKIKDIKNFIISRFKQTNNQNLNYYLLIKNNIKTKKFLFLSLFLSVVLSVIIFLIFTGIYKSLKKDFNVYIEIDRLIKNNDLTIKIENDDINFIKDLKEIIKSLHDIKDKTENMTQIMNSMNVVDTYSFLKELQEKIGNESIKGDEKKFYLKKIESIDNENNQLLQSLNISNNKEKTTELIIGIKSIDNFIQNVIDNILSVNKAISEAMNAIDSLEEIAERSHLLSINATIEATSENENKRFSIVASEIRKLAKESKEVTMKIKSDFNKIKELIGEKSAEDINNTKDMLDELKTFEDFFNKYFEKQKKLTDNIKANIDDSSLITQKIIDSINNTVENIKVQIETIKNISDNTKNCTKKFESLESNIKQINKMIDGVLKNEEN